MPYDSAPETKKHMARVAELLGVVTDMLHERGLEHDQSKLSKQEKPYFDEYTQKLRDTTYESEEYRKYRKELKVALDLHYAANRHHPEHYKRGIMGMTLIDLVEMLMDWKAAGERHADGNIMRSLMDNGPRFQIPPSLRVILENTIQFLWPEDVNTYIEEVNQAKSDGPA